ncbi:MAG: ion channel [Pseudomonadota bacterium]|nr:ion channel [Pseudomonadota bacterium]
MSELRQQASRTALFAVLQHLYEGDSAQAHAFRYGLLVFDVVTILFLIVSSFFPRTAVTETLDVVIGVIILADFAARLSICPRPLRTLLHPLSLAEIAAIISFLAPLLGEGFAFLRVLRTVRILHSYQLLARLRQDAAFFRRNEEVITAVTNLSVFIFIMTGLVYETQHRTNPQIGNYADALYFTITALTTTGFGDITLPGTLGRMLSVVIMIFGVTLFLRLAQVLFRPSKVRHECPDCGLTRHDPDAVHCKHCGRVLHIETEGAV